MPTLVIDETDTVSIRTAFDNRLAFVIGGGVSYAMNPRFSLRLDVRDLMYGDSQRTELDATPSTVPNSNSGLISDSSADRVRFVAARPLDAQRRRDREFRNVQGNGHHPPDPRNRSDSSGSSESGNRIIG